MAIAHQLEAGSWWIAVQDLPEILARSETIDQAGQEVLRLICQSSDCACGIRWQALRGRLLCVDTWSDGTEITKQFLAAVAASPSLNKQTSGFLHTVRVTGEPSLTCALSEDEARAALIGATGLHTSFAFPLKSGADIVGIFQFFARSTKPGDAEVLKACRFIGALLDQFLQRRETEQQLRESDVFARKLADVSADWYWEHDAESRVTHLSPSIRDVIGVDPQLVIGKARAELRGTLPLNCTWEEYKALIDARKPYRDLEYRRINDQGEHIYYTVSGVPLFGKGNSWAIGVLDAISRRADALSSRPGESEGCLPPSAPPTKPIRVRSHRKTFTSKSATPRYTRVSSS